MHSQEFLFTGTEKHSFSAKHWFSKQCSAPVFIAVLLGLVSQGHHHIQTPPATTMALATRAPCTHTNQQEGTGEHRNSANSTCRFQPALRNNASTTASLNIIPSLLCKTALESVGLLKPD